MIKLSTKRVKKWIYIASSCPSGCKLYVACRSQIIVSLRWSCDSNSIEAYYRDVCRKHFYPIAPKTLNWQFAAVLSQSWCIFGYATIITRLMTTRIWSKLTIFAMPTYSFV